MGNKPTEGFFLLPLLPTIDSIPLSVVPRNWSKSLLRNAGEGVGRDIQKITVIQKRLSAQGLAGFCVCGKILLAHLSTETTFLSLFNDLLLEINTGQMPMSLWELPVSDANNRELSLTHVRGDVPIQLRNSCSASRRASPYSIPTDLPGLKGDS